MMREKCFVIRPVQNNRHMARWTLYFLGILLTAGGLSGCSNLQNLTYMPHEPIIASRMGDVSSASLLAANIMKKRSNSGKTINLEQVPALAGHKSLQDYRPDRAFAIGYPKECGGSWHAWGQRGIYAAAQKALSSCLSYREGYDEHTAASCSCRLVLLNKTILASPGELNFHRRSPVTLYFRRRDTGKTEIVKGMTEYTGEVGSNLSMRLFNYNGKQMCSGSYSITMFEAVLGAGTFSLTCFDGETTLNGELRIKRIANPKGKGSISVVVGTADISSGDQVALIVGIPYSLAQKHPELIENVAQ